MNYFFRHICVGVCFVGMFALFTVNPAYAVSFAIDHIDVYEDGKRMTEDVVLIEYEGIIEMCEAGTCSLGQQYKQNPTLHRLREPLKNFEKWQKEYLAKRSKCLEDGEGKKPGAMDGCGSVENASYSKMITLPALEDRSVHYVDPKMPMGGMIGAHRYFKVDLKTAQIEKDEYKESQTDTNYSTKGYVIFVSYCPPCPEEAVCATCPPDFIIISPQKKVIQYPDQMGPEDKVVLTHFRSGFSLGKKYKFRLKISQANYEWGKKNTFELVDFEPIASARK